ncbi:MAG: tripartite tricarboxylate transporter substrate binding protein [Burkholderiales bacterium]|nr:tripartite tricarboxylate transporter substrate binding protein [Burkholderiales bacterium]
MSEGLGRQIVIENRGGAGTLIGTELVAKAPPDGHTLLLVTSTISINPSTYKNLPYNTMRDLAPVTLVSSMPHTVIAHPSLPATTLPALVRLAKSRPGQLLYPSSGIGSANHLDVVLLARRLGIEVTHIPYKGSSQWQADLMTGNVHFALASPLGSLPLARNGKVRLLATTGAERLPMMPDIPTVAESLAPGYTADNWFGMFAPAGTPPEIVERVHREVVKTLAIAAIHSKFVDSGTQPAGMSPEAFTKFFRSEVEKWAQAVKLADIKIE